jgi:hypothetical protein
MVHAAQQTIRITNDLMGALSLYVCHESNATAVSFLIWAVQTMRWW